MSRNSDSGNKKSSKKSHPLYELINNATDNFLPAENDELNRQICSEILRTSESPKIAAKVINKVINKSLNGHSHQSIWYSLLLLDVAVKSTDSRFCAAILTKEFLVDLIKIIEPRYQVPEFVQEKLMYILKEWYSSLTNVTGYPNLVKYYKSIQYPQHRAQPFNVEVPMHGTQRIYPTALDAMNFAPQPVFPAHNLNFKDKILHDIDIIETNLTIFSDTIRCLDPETITNEEVKFLQELYDTGMNMQERINEILPSIVWEDITNQLIQVNDKILFTADRYKRLMKNKAQLTLSPSAKPTSSSAMEEMYDISVDNKISPNACLPEIYAPGSLPSYSEALSIQAKKKQTDQDLINFDDEEELISQSYKNLPLPSIPNQMTNRPLPPINTSTNYNDSANKGLSSNDFDEFIEQIARRQVLPSEPLDEIYAPPLYDEAMVKPNKQN